MLHTNTLNPTGLLFTFSAIIIVINHCYIIAIVGNKFEHSTDASH